MNTGRVGGGEEEGVRKEENTRFQEEGQDEEEDDPYSTYSLEDLLLWMGKGPGKGNNKGKSKNWKGGVPRNLPLLRRLRALNQRVPEKRTPT